MPKSVWWIPLLAACGARPTPVQVPADLPTRVDCSAEVPTEPPASAIEALCAADRGTPLPEALRTPPPMDRLAAKNAYDLTLRDWFRERGYRKAGWQHDRTWRLTGPAEEPLGGPTYGVHPGVRIWYSPEVMDWLCGGREGPIADGAMLVKEMVGLGALTKHYEVIDDHWAPTEDFDPDTVEPGSWTVMVRSASASADGWYWANPTAADGEAPNGRGNPPIEGISASMGDAGSPDHAAPIDPHWYPTGVDFSDPESQPSVVYPYSAYGAYCLNCHASAATQSTFASFENLLGDGAHYTRLHPGQSCAQWPETPEREAPAADLDFPRPHSEPDPTFTAFYDQLEPVSLADAWPHRFPAETYDHVVAPAEPTDSFPTSDQCIGCHDATISNARIPQMVLVERSAEGEVQRNLSPYGEWRASPMGLAGRDPVFFSQLASETNHLPEALAACVESTCLRCHGVMGARQKAHDTALDENPCAALYGEPPPDAVQFGEPLRRESLYRWPGEPDADVDELHYAAQGRDGISCAVCHRITDEALDENRSFTGNWVAGPADALFGPFADVVTAPMEQAIGRTPKANPVVQRAELCGTCHNILLPVFAEDGTPWMEDGAQAFRYEQSTHLEWKNSAFSDPETGRTCQDCHMPHDWQGTALDFPIANIEDQTFPRTTHALPEDQRTVQPRKAYRRHALHGLNLTLNQFFQQFPLILGVRQQDYMTGAMAPSLITARDSMLQMARHETATVAVRDLAPTEDGVEATVRVESLAGHNLPSGVGFRRLVLQVEAIDSGGQVVWASGRTNALGAVVSGLTDEVLPFERPVENPTAFEPHHERIDRMDQVQLYEEVVTGSDDRVNTSFLRRVKVAKDNRIRPRGHDPHRYQEDDSKFVRALAHEGPADDPDYTDPDRTGADELVYAIALGPEVARPVTVRASLFSQTVPPSYLQHRFADAKVGPANDVDIQRLYALTSHLSTADGAAHLDQWKVALASGEATEASAD